MNTVGRTFTKRAVCFGAVLLSAAASPTQAQEGLIPEACHISVLSVLPSPPEGTLSANVHFSPTGRPFVLYRDRIFMLPETTNQPLVDATPSLNPEGGGLRDFCLLSSKTWALLQADQLLFVRDGNCITNLSLPFAGMKLAQAGSGGCYLFGGDQNAESSNDVFRVGLDGTVKNLLRAPQTVTAVAGTGDSTFVAIGPAVYFLAGDQSPREVFRERSDIQALAVAGTNGLFYATANGIGCIQKPHSGLVLIEQEVLSMDARGNRLLVLNKQGEVLLFDPADGFAPLAAAVEAFLDDTAAQ